MSTGFGRAAVARTRSRPSSRSGVNAKRLWWLDADLVAAFDRVDHNHIMSMLGSFPGNGLIRQWLAAGVIEAGLLSDTTEGVPQGGVISPLIFNVAVHGMAEAAGVRYVTSPSRAGDTKAGSPVLVAYADDLVVGCHSQRQAEQVQQRLADWLRPRGLAFNEAKTQIVRAPRAQEGEVAM